MKTIVNPSMSGAVLWPIPESIPVEVAGTFPGEEAVELLVQSTRTNFATEQEARESAIAFVNRRRRMLAEEHAQ